MLLIQLGIFYYHYEIIPLYKRPPFWETFSEKLNSPLPDFAWSPLLVFYSFLNNPSLFFSPQPSLSLIPFIFP